MFLALRDIRFARGRFALLGGTVALLALLVQLLTALTAGLAQQSVSALLAADADRVVLSASDGENATFATSRLDESQVEAWTAAPGVDSVRATSITMTAAESPAGRTPVALVGGASDLGASEVRLPRTVAQELAVNVGDEVTLGRAQATVAAIGENLWFSHAPVVEASLEGAQAAAPGGAPIAALLVRGGADWESIDQVAATTSSSPLVATLAIDAFRSEMGSLALIIAMLTGIGAVVIAAFFAVWTMQRASDVAVLRALGIGSRSIRADAAGQAALVLVGGIGAACAVTLALSGPLANAVPLVVSPLTIAVPGVLLAITGLAGALISLRPLTRVDPLEALGGHR